MKMSVFDEFVASGVTFFISLVSLIIVIGLFGEGKSHDKNERRQISKEKS
jgi:hypothetical protein